MNRPIDLMPASCRVVLGRRTLVRRWTIAYAATATLILAGHTVLSAGNSSRSQQRAALANQVRINWSRSESVQQLVKEIAEVEEEINRFNRLSWPVHSSEIIRAVGAACEDSITLTGMGLTPREERKTPGAPAPKPSPTGEPAPPEAPRMLMIVDLEGVALSDGAIASFVSVLDGNPLFSRVGLDFTKSREVDGVEARAFRITCEVDLSARYTQIATGTEATP